MRKTIYLLFVFFFLFSWHSQAQNRAVVLVFDDSGSMQGAPFLSVDYSMQMVIGLLHPQDELFYIKGINAYEAKKININDKNQAIEGVQKWTNLKGHGFYGMFETAMTKLSSPEWKDKEKWLMVTADGEWRDIKPEKQAVLDAFLKETKTNIVFLNINNTQEGQNTLYPLLSNFEFVDLYNSLPEPTNLRSELVKIATTLSAFPTKGFEVQSNGTKVSFASELPIQEILILEQAAVSPDKLSNISSVKVDEKNVAVASTTELSTFPVMPNWKRPESTAARMSAKMTRVNDQPGIIPAGATVEVNFDRNINLDNLEFLPKVAAKLVVTAEPIGKDFKAQTNHSYQVCDTEQEAVISAQLVAFDGSPLSKDILKKVTVTARYEGDTIALKLNKQTFSNKIPLDTDLTAVAVTAFYEGYLNLRAEVLELQKVPCPKLKIENIRLEKSISVLDLDTQLEYEVLPRIMREKREVTKDIYDDLELKELDNTGVGFKMTKRNGKFIFETYTAAAWLCTACLSKSGQDSVTYTITSTNPNHEFASTPTITLVVNKTDVNFWMKCNGCLLRLLLLILFLTYLFGVLKKPRFDRSALITYRRVTEYVPSRNRNYELRTGFFSRYLVPFIAEKKTIQGVLFQAGEDDSYITLPKKSQKKGMYIQNNEIQKPGVQERQLIANGKLEIRRRNRTDEFVYRKN